MNIPRFNQLTLAAAALAASSGIAAACQTINFENLAVGAAVTNQYVGVTFSVTIPGSCGGGITRYPRIIDPPEGTSSGIKALGSDEGCPSFWPDALRMVFVNPQQEVRFTLGNYSTGTYAVRAWDAAVGGLQVGLTQNIDLEGNGYVAVYRRVTVVGPNIRRIEIDSTVSNEAVIDDLEFDIDTTPPVAAIDAPDSFNCACSPITIRGTANDPDGILFRRRLEYATDESGPWTLLSNSATPVINNTLYTWNTAGRTEGYYYLRLTVTNVCDLATVVTTVVFVDRQYDTVSIRYPEPGRIVGGAVCVDGTVSDHRARDLDSYAVLYGPAGAGFPIGPVDPAHPSYSGTVLNDPLTNPTSWNTAVGPTSVPDGPWRIAVTATDTCGFTGVDFHDIIVDNTPPAAAITSPVSCATVCGIVPVIGTANDLHFNHWYLEYTGGDAHGWAPLANGGAPVIGGVLFNWNTAGLRRCAYTIRLRVYDTASVNCNSTTNYTEYSVSVNVGSPGDFNRDGVVNSQDFFDFLAVFFAPPPC